MAIPDCLRTIVEYFGARYAIPCGRAVELRDVHPRSPVAAAGNNDPPPIRCGGHRGPVSHRSSIAFGFACTVSHERLVKTGQAIELPRNAFRLPGRGPHARWRQHRDALPRTHEIVEPGEFRTQSLDQS